MSDLFFIFSMHFDRDSGLDWGRLSLNSLAEGTKVIWTATTSTADKQGPEDFHQKGGLIPPQYRCNIRNWKVETTPINMQSIRGVEGNFYKINPREVITDKGGIRGDFGIHKDANVPGSLGCIVLDSKRFGEFEQRITKLAKTIKTIPLFVQYS